MKKFFFNQTARWVSIGNGAYVQRYRLPSTEVSRIWTGKASMGPVKEKGWWLDWMKMCYHVPSRRHAMPC
jgi:hypothetical protein